MLVTPTISVIVLLIAAVFSRPSVIPEEEDPLLVVFQHIDGDGDGGISLEEALKYAVETGQNPDDQKSEFASADENQDGRVTMEEFVESVKAELLAVQFKEMDRDGDESISVEEVATAIREGADPTTPMKVIEKIHSTGDLNSDGLIGFEEFKMTHKRIKQMFEEFQVTNL